MPTIASTGKPITAGFTLAIGKMAPFLTMRSTRLRTVGSETPTARAMLAKERRALGRSSRMMRRSSSSISIVPNGACPALIMAPVSLRDGHFGPRHHCCLHSRKQVVPLETEPQSLHRFAKGRYELDTAGTGCHCPLGRSPGAARYGREAAAGEGSGPRRCVH